ncbi:MAG: Hpt domain-containing protein, partial [Hormoscilla sp.]
MIEDSELRELYKTVSAEHLALLEQGLLHLEKHPEDTQRLEEVLRSAHTLKGDSRMLGVSDVEAITHQIEQVLVKLSEDQNALQGGMCDRLYRALDALSKLVSEAVTGSPSGVKTSELLAQLMAPTQSEPVEQSKNTPQQQVHGGKQSNIFIEDSQLREVYKTSTLGHLQKLEAGLSHLEKHPDDSEILEEVLRSAHTLKGDSRMLGVSDVESIAHEMEQVVGKLKEDQNALQGGMCDRLYQAVDAIGKLV